MSAFDRLSSSGPPLSPAAERRMFSRLRLADGIFKTTVACRLADVDAATIALLPDERAGIVEIIDVGASSGTTSLELVEALTATGRRPALTLTDLALTARLVPLHRGYSVLLDSRGSLLLHMVMGMPVRPWRRRLDYVTQFWIVTAGVNAWHRRLAVRDSAKSCPAGSAILLVSPQAAAHPAITCEESDVFAPAPEAHAGRFDIVRAANLLLPEVFSAERISAAIGQLKARLRGPGALLVLARSPAPGRAGTNRATIYRLGEDGMLEIAGRVGAGSDIEALVGT